MTHDPPDHPTFFDAGLQFECRRCGACCTGDPGTVYAAPAEAARIARFLGLTEAQLTQQYLYPLRDGFGIREDADGRCAFFTGACAVYPARPGQCAAFPFWLGHLRSKQRWRELGRTCPGIGQGRRYSKEEIMAAMGCWGMG